MIFCFSYHYDNFLVQKKNVSIWEEPQNDQVMWIDVFLFLETYFLLYSSN